MHLRTLSSINKSRHLDCTLLLLTFQDIYEYSLQIEIDFLKQMMDTRFYLAWGQEQHHPHKLRERTSHLFLVDSFLIMMEHRNEFHQSFFPLLVCTTTCLQKCNFNYSGIFCSSYSSCIDFLSKYNCMQIKSSKEYYKCHFYSLLITLPY